jgi:hypothetical protein
MSIFTSKRSLLSFFAKSRTDWASICGLDAKFAQEDIKFRLDLEKMLEKQGLQHLSSV